MQEDNAQSALIFGCAIAFGLMLALLVVGIAVAALVIGQITPASSSTQTASLNTPPVLYHTTAPDGGAYAWQVVVGGYDNPIGVYHANENGRIFAIEQTGKIWIIENGRELAEPFLDVSNLLSADVMRGTYTERGLLGLAFHPEYADNGQFFISYTDREGDSVIARYRVSENADRADANSAEILLTVDQPFYDHNGGPIAFGHDGNLYIGLGDGGSVDDPFGNGQNPAALLGKILRIDVDSTPAESIAYAIPTDNPYVSTPGYAPEIFALGFRNPWKLAFDRATGDLYIGDVGQWMWEEVDFIPFGDTRGGNYGWNIYEADLLRAGEVPQDTRFTAPILTFPHTEGCAVTGGTVYRGTAMPELEGYYFYGDYCNGRLWTAWRTTEGVWQSSVFMETERQITGFGEDAAGELYMTDYKGDILRLVPAQ